MDVFDIPFSYHKDSIRACNVELQMLKNLAKLEPAEIDSIRVYEWIEVSEEQEEEGSNIFLRSVWHDDMIYNDCGFSCSVFRILTMRLGRNLQL